MLEVIAIIAAIVVLITMMILLLGAVAMWFERAVDRAIETRINHTEEMRRIKREEDAVSMHQSQMVLPPESQS